MVPGCLRLLRRRVGLDARRRVGGTADPDAECTCPFPILGVYDTLETVERAMGMQIPATIRAAACRRPLFADPRGAQRAWGRIWATEVHRTGDDGSILSTFAPAWEDNPYSPVWDEDNFPLL